MAVWIYRFSGNMLCLTVSVAALRRSTAVERASSGVSDCWDSIYVRKAAFSGFSLVVSFVDFAASSSATF